MIKIDSFRIQEDKVFIVAELSANHNGNFDLAVKTIEEIKNSGADAVKLQTYTADSITIDMKTPMFMTNPEGIWAGRTLYGLYREAATPYEWHEKLFRIARESGLVCFSSPFDFTGVDFLETLQCPAYKIASFEITDIPLIKYIAAKGKPVIISTGVAAKTDIDLAVSACKEEGNDNIILLKCTSEYPAPFEEVNLRTIPGLAVDYKLPVGLSDHTPGCEVAIAAVALGACVVEKHFILDRSLGGPDAAFSMNPAEFKEMVNAIRNVEKALGTANFELTLKAQRSKEHARSLFVVKDIRQGEIITTENVRSIRPGYGLHPKFLPEITGKIAIRDLKRGEPFSLDMINPF